MGESWRGSVFRYLKTLQVREMLYFSFLTSLIVGKESACNAGDTGSIPGSGRSPGEGIGYPLQYPGLENSMDCTVCGVAKSRTRLSDFRFQREEPGLVFTEKWILTQQ